MREKQTGGRKTYLVKDKTTKYQNCGYSNNFQYSTNFQIIWIFIFQITFWGSFLYNDLCGRENLRLIGGGCNADFLPVQLNMTGASSACLALMLSKRAQITSESLSSACCCCCLPMMVRWFREPTQQTVVPCWFSVTSLLEMRWAAVQTERRWDHRCHSLAWAAVGTRVGLNLSRSGPERMSTIYLVQIFLMPSDLFNTISCLLLIQDTLDRFLCKCVTYVMMHPIYFSQDYPSLAT